MWFESLQGEDIFLCKATRRCLVVVVTNLVILSFEVLLIVKFNMN